MYNVDWAPTVDMVCNNRKKRQEQKVKSKLSKRRGQPKSGIELKRLLRVIKLKEQREELLKQGEPELKEGCTLNPIIHRITTGCIVVLEQSVSMKKEDVACEKCK